jgi:hypothetical protein
MQALSQWLVDVLECRCLFFHAVITVLVLTCKTRAGITHPTGMQGHLDDLLFDLKRLIPITLVQQKGAPGTAVFAAPVPLLALPGLPLADDIGPVTVRTVQDLENHEATRSR